MRFDPIFLQVTKI